MEISENINELFSSDELHALKELGIDPRSLVFTKSSILPLGSLSKPKQFVCHLRVTDGLYSFDFPERLPRKFKKEIELIEKKLLIINNSHIKRLMQTSKKNAEFIERFNSELFFKHSFFQGRRITTPELFDFYETHPYYQTINLSADVDKAPFIALYAMTFYACSCEDLFTVDGIFSMQPERHADNAKKTAGNAVFNLILRDNKEEMEQVLSQMRETLVKIPPLRVDVAEPQLLAKNYTLFAGLAEIGRVFNSQELMRYAHVVSLCDTISVIYDEDDYRESSAYKKCVELF
jgi:hypothetical protein